MGQRMKKLNRETARAQAKRLQSSPMLAPQSDDGRKEIIDCLMRNCDDAEHAESTMTQVLDNCDDPRNLTAEIRAAAVATLHRSESVPDGCDVCRLMPDPLTGAARWMAHVPFERNGYSYAVRCNCERGRWLKRRDHERGSAVPKQEQRRGFAHVGAGVQDEGGAD
jgi:hypothetical protein